MQKLVAATKGLTNKRKMILFTSRRIWVFRETGKHTKSCTFPTRTHSQHQSRQNSIHVTFGKLLAVMQHSVQETFRCTIACPISARQKHTNRCCRMHFYFCWSLRRSMSWRCFRSCRLRCQEYILPVAPWRHRRSSLSAVLPIKIVQQLFCD